MLTAFKPTIFQSVSTIPSGATVDASGPRFQVFGFTATARTIDTSNTAGEANVNDDATRTATRCFMRGIKERLKYETTSGRSYLHRRICLTFMGQEFIKRESDGLTGSLWQESSAGYVRALTNVLGIGSDTETWNQMAQVIFKGQVNEDWSDLITAKVDNQRVKLMYDRTYTIRSGNDTGIQKERKLWHAMNKTLIYNDDEAGGSKLPSELSANNRQSMGDYYIFDIFDVGEAPVDEGDQLGFAVQATLYWHER